MDEWLRIILQLPNPNLQHINVPQRGKVISLK